MIKTVQLTNFRKHENLTVNFTAGMNAIRAGNEHGKSTVLNAIAYAFFGAKALNEPLADVVTYGKKESELKVVLTFSAHDVDYTLKRSKSGAELTFGIERITGQTEVTAYVESIFGCSAAVASKLMIAKQSAVAGALADGPTGAAKLIETMANFELITDLIDLVQEKLPSGNTGAQEALILQLAEQSKQVPVNQIPDKEAKLQEAEAGWQIALSAIPTPIDVGPIRSAVAKHISDTAAYKQLESQLDQQNAILDAPLPPEADKALIESLQKVESGRPADVQAVAVYAELLKMSVTLSVKKNYIEFFADLQKAEAAVKTVEKSIADLRMQRVRAVSKAIKDQTCGLCGKDLQDVPEVVKLNAEVQVQVAAIDTAIAEGTEKLAEELTQLTLLQQVNKDHNKLVVLLAKANSHVQLDESTTPPGWTWVGPREVPASVAAELAAEKVKELTYAAALGKQGHATTVRSGLVARLHAARNPTEAEMLELQRQHAAAVLRNTEVSNAQHAARLAEDQRNLAKAALDQEIAVFAEALKSLERIKVQLAEATAILASQNFNNTLVKKLRLARPKVADKLWSIVLASVSGYFSAIRGEVSAVTKTEDGFRINGRPMLGLSGSTIDSLGLAIRLALTKTFLPNARFLVLDEVAAGMDDTREAAMLGLVASCGMDQVILVTHSLLADSFASNVITF